MDPWSHGPLESWTNIVMDPWSHGPLKSWTREVMDPCSHGPMESWTHGVMDPWLHVRLSPVYQKPLPQKCSVGEAVSPCRCHCPVITPPPSHSPSSPPLWEKSRSRMIHFWMRCALEVASLLTLLIPSWTAAWITRSRPPASSETLVALLPNFLQNSMASGVSSSSESPDSGFIWHWREEHELLHYLLLPFVCSLFYFMLLYVYYMLYVYMLVLFV